MKAELNPLQWHLVLKNLILFKNLEEFKPSKKYDIVTMFDVLEHLPNPSKEINKVKILKKGFGLCLRSKLGKRNKNAFGREGSYFIWPTHHLTYFSPKILMTFSKRIKVLDWETQGLDLYDYKWFKKHKLKKDSLTEKEIEVLQFYINSSGHGKIYNYLKKIKFLSIYFFFLKTFHWTPKNIPQKFFFLYFHQIFVFGKIIEILTINF